MNLQQGLTIDNFWNEISAAYPKATNIFLAWIDEYKKAVKWDDLFRNGYKDPRIVNPVKFHDLPLEMQVGIWIEFVQQTLHQYFEQPEYEYCMDLEEDIKTVFRELEPEITNED